MNLLDLLYLPLAAITAPWWARKTRSGWAERFGRIDRLPDPAPGTKRVLLHAVSVGEVSTLRGLVPLLCARDYDIVVSVGTDTGIARARDLYGELPGVHVVRYPLDASWSVRRFFDSVRPDAIALVELEVWPNFVRAAADRGIPIGVINGRLSARSFKGYARLRGFFRRTFERLDVACVQDAEYAERFRHMGVRPDRVRITGSMKWDATHPVAAAERRQVPGAQELAREMGIDLSRPLVVAGSTAPIPGSSEEALLHAAVPAGVQLLCAPRKPEHREAAFAALGGAVRCVKRSSKTPAKIGTDRFLLDTIGELRAAYALADVAVVGRTFGDLGGSDPIEPIALSVPTVVGPAMKNFESVMRTFRDADAIVETTAQGLGPAIARLLNDKAEAAALAERGVECILAQQGATVRHAEAIEELLLRAKPRASGKLT